MNPLADLTKAPVVYTIGAVSYELSPHTTEDLGALCRFAQFLGWQNAQQAGLPKEALDIAMAICVREAVTMHSPIFNSALATFEGKVESVFLSLKHKHPKITRADVKALDAIDIGNMSGLIAVINTPPEMYEAIYADPSEEAKKKMAALEQVIDILRKQKKLT